MSTGTKHDPWQLSTAPGSSQYTMWRDEDGTPALVCQVGSTTLKYHLRAIDDLHAWLREQGDWVELGAADERKPDKDGTVEAWGALAQEPNRRLVRPAQRLPRPLRHVPTPAARAARLGRTHPREAQQPHAGPLSGASRAVAAGAPVTISADARRPRAGAPAQ
jgi:hypothetical protein